MPRKPPELACTPLPPLLTPQIPPLADGVATWEGSKTQVRWNPAELKSPTILARKRYRRRELKDARRAETAKAALIGLSRDPAVEIYGFTKGQFSFLDLIAAALEHTGPAAVTVATWTAAKYELANLADLQTTGRMGPARFLLDYTFAQRDPAAASFIRETFGRDSFRVTQTHCKFALFEKEGAKAWKVCIRTSANLNRNARCEDFTAGHDPELHDFLAGIVAELWDSTRELSAGRPDSRTVRAHFRGL